MDLRLHSNEAVGFSFHRLVFDPYIISAKERISRYLVFFPLLTIYGVFQKCLRPQIYFPIDMALILFYLKKLENVPTENY